VEQKSKLPLGLSPAESKRCVSKPQTPNKPQTKSEVLNRINGSAELHDDQPYPSCASVPSAYHNYFIAEVIDQDIQMEIRLEAPDADEVGGQDRWSESTSESIHILDR